MYSYLHWQCDMEDSVWSLERKTHVSCVDTECHNIGSSTIVFLILNKVTVCSCRVYTYLYFHAGTGYVKRK